MLFTIRKIPISRVRKYIIKVNRFNWTCTISRATYEIHPDLSSEKYPGFRRNSVSFSQLKDMDCVHLGITVQKMGADGAHLKDIIAQ